MRFGGAWAESGEDDSRGWQFSVAGCPLEGHHPLAKRVKGGALLKADAPGNNNVPHRVEFDEAPSKMLRWS